MDEATKKNVCSMLIVSIILVLILILITMNDICKMKKQGSESFADEKEKSQRANEVISSVGSAFQSNPNMTFDQSKSYLPSINAVEYKDVKTIVGSGQPLNSDTLVSMW